MELVAVASDSEAEQARIREEFGAAIRFVSDPELRIIRAWGMEDLSPMPNRPLARAGIFHVDAAGIVRRRWLADSMQSRADPSAILHSLP